MTKVCLKCGVKKPIDEFPLRRDSKDGHRNSCKLCLKRYRTENKKHLQELNQKWRKANREYDNLRHQNYRLKNKTRLQEKSREYHRRNRDKRHAYYEQNKKHFSERAKIYYQKNKTTMLQHSQRWHREHTARHNYLTRRHYQEHKEYYAHRMKENIHYRIKTRLSIRIRKAIVFQHGTKSLRTLELLGCSIADVRKHLESKFKPGMSWEAFKKGQIHIDHIKPCSKFDLTDPEQQKKCFHYTNLQPLWAKENLMKGAKFEQAS